MARDLNAFRYQLQQVSLPTLSVPFTRPFHHRPERSHSAVDLERSTLIKDRASRALRQSGKQTTDHYRTGSGCDRFGYVTAEADTAVGNQGHACRQSCFAGVHDGRDLRYTYSGYHSSRADRTGPIPTFTASAPASIKSRAPSKVATLPATTSMDQRLLISFTVLITFSE